MDDDKHSGKSLGEILGTKMGEILVISMYQARATLTLAKAIQEDSSTSPDVKAAAQESLAVIDQIIEKMEQFVGDDAMASIRPLVGKTE
ncbi:hypothetical protein [Pseudomonas sp. NFACC13-1]|uniref:hypothetical protein n=1 Tax=Pseudomonas sp. NFACC13-1 TaxID=1566245 RepID=UPI000B83F3CE|nr:hypothetical protein [Pseudomonas sp. NFACC13-1]